MADTPFTPPMCLGGLGVAAAEPAPLSAEEAAAALARAPPGLSLAQRPEPPTEPPPRPPPGPPPPPPLLGGAPLVLGLLGTQAPIHRQVGGQVAVKKEVGSGRPGVVAAPVGKPQVQQQPQLPQPVQHQPKAGRRAAQPVGEGPDEPLAHNSRLLAPADKEVTPVPSRKQGAQNLAPGGGALAASKAPGGGVIGTGSDAALGRKGGGGSAVVASKPLTPKEVHERRPFTAAECEGDAWDTDAATGPVVQSKETAAAPASVPRTNSLVAPNRPDLIREVFLACDVDGDGWLGEREMRAFAGFFGFKGTETKWAAEFKLLCKEKGADAAKGISPTLLFDLVNDEADGLYLGNGGLDAMLRYLQDLQQASNAGKAGNARPGSDDKSRSPGGPAAAGPASPAGPEGDEFYAKLKRTVMWYNKHGVLPAPIRLENVYEVLAEIRPGQAMKILYDLDAKDKDTLADPTGWIIAEGHRRKAANDAQAANPKANDGSRGDFRGERGDNFRGGEFRKNSGGPSSPNDAREGAPAAAAQGKGQGYAGTKGGGGSPADGERDFRRGPGGYQQNHQQYQNHQYGDSHGQQKGDSGMDQGMGMGKGGGKGKGKGKNNGYADQEAEGEEDEFTSKMRRTVNWYNRHGGLLAPINFKEVVAGIVNTDPRVAMRILNDLDQANAEAVLSDPTKWILSEAIRRVNQPGADKGPAAPKSNFPRKFDGAANEPPPQPKPSALSKSLTGMPMRLGPPKKTTETPAVP